MKIYEIEIQGYIANQDEDGIASHLCLFLSGQYD